MTRPRTTTPALVGRMLRDDRRVGAVVLIVTLVAAALLTALPRAVDTLADEILRDRIAATTPLVRDLSARPTEFILGASPAKSAPRVPPEWQAELGLMDSSLEAARSAVSGPLAQIIGPGHFRLATKAILLDPVPGHDVRFPKIELVADPHLQEKATLTSGRWAKAIETDQPALSGDEGFEVTLAESSALRLAWAVGETQTIIRGATVTLVGTYAADDPADPYWTRSPAAAAPRIINDPDLGLEVVGAAYVGGTVAPMLHYQPKLSLWYPVDASSLTAAQLDEVISQLRGFTAVRQDVGVPATFSTELVPVLERIQRDLGAMTSLVAFLASGPIAVLLMLLVAAVRMVQERHRATLALLRARGASALQIRGLFGIEGLVLGLVGAGAGTALGLVLLPGPVSPAMLAGPALVACTPAVVLAMSSTPTTLRLGRPGRSRMRWVWETLVVAAAALATVQLVRRGIAGPGGLDPMLVAVPALIAVAVAIIVVRCSPALLSVVVAAAAAGRGALAFIGSASAQRDGRGRLPSAVGLVVAVAVAVLSTVLLTTVRSGLDAEAWTSVGADLRVSGPHIDDAKLDEVRALDGVVAAATVTDVTSAALTTVEGRSPVQVLLVDSGDLARVQDTIPGWSVPTEIGVSGDAPMAALLAEDFDASSGPVELSVDARTIELTAVGSAPAVPGASLGTRWVMLERSVVAEATGKTYRPRVLLVRYDDALSADRVKSLVDEVLAITGPGATELRSEAVAERLSDPALAGLQAAVLVALLTALALGAGTVAASEAAAQPRREHLFGVLEILGMPRRQGQVVSVWEVASWTVPSIIGGLGLGLMLPTLVARVIDLRAFTGGDGQVPLVHDPGWVALVVGVFVVVVVACGVASAVLGRKVSSAALLRSVQE